MTEQTLNQEVMIDGQQVLSIATPDIVNNHVAETIPHSTHTVEVDPMKLQVMQNAVAKIEKAFGTCAIMRMNDESIEDVDVIPTGSIGLDRALGVGGYPRGRIVEIYGPESSGKTTLALHAIAQAQQMGGIAAYIDAEHAFDRSYAEAVGVNTRNLWISQPDNGEQALEIADQLIRSAAIDVIVIDSVAALTPKAEIEGHHPEKRRTKFPDTVCEVCRSPQSDNLSQHHRVQARFFLRLQARTPQKSQPYTLGRKESRYTTTMIPPSGFRL